MKRMLKLRRFRYHHSCSPDFQDLVESLLQTSPWDRIPLIKIFEHPWVLSMQAQLISPRTDLGLQTLSDPLKPQSKNLQSLNIAEKKRSVLDESSVIQINETLDEVGWHRTIPRHDKSV